MSRILCKNMIKYGGWRIRDYVRNIEDIRYFCIESNKKCSLKVRDGV